MRKKAVWPYLLIAAAGAFVFFALFKRMGSVIRVLFCALAIAFLLEPAVSRLERRTGRTPAMAVCFLSLAAALALVAFLVILPALGEIARLPEYAKGALSGLQAFAAFAEEALLKRKISVSLTDMLGTGLTSAAGSAWAHLLSAASGAAGLFANIMAAAALSWFFLADWKHLSLRLFLCVPSGIRPRVVSAVKGIRRDLGGYLRAQVLLISVMGVLTTCTLFLTGAPMPVSLGVMYALLNAIPYFGPLIGMIPPVLAALYVSWKNAAYTFAALLLIQQVDNYVLSPRIMGASSGSGPAAVLIAITAGGALFGVGGMFLALPVMVSAKAVYRAFTAPAVGMYTKITKGNEKKH